MGFIYMSMKLLLTLKSNSVIPISVSAAVTWSVLTGDCSLQDSSIFTGKAERKGSLDSMAFFHKLVVWFSTKQ